VPGIVFKGPGFYVTDNRKNHGSEEREEKPALDATAELSAKP
jgi:predicted nucleic acid-binding Zn ribbon protein